jgi:hypothetical protein
MFNRFSGLEYLHTKCNIVHGDLSINNIVIYRTPSSHPPSNPSKPSGKMGPKELPALQMTWTSKAAAQAAFIPTPKEGLTESIPVTGVVIDYDYSRKVGTVMEKTSVASPLFPELFSIHILFFFASGHLTFHDACLFGPREAWHIYPRSSSGP